jgi:hypothetical protein
MMAPAASCFLGLVEGEARSRASHRRKKPSTSLGLRRSQIRWRVSGSSHARTGDLLLVQRALRRRLISKDSFDPFEQGRLATLQGTAYPP